MFVLAGAGISLLVEAGAQYLERAGVSVQRVALASRLAAVALVVLLLTNGIPFISGEFIPKVWLNGDAKSVVMPPQYWSDATDYLNAQQDDSRVLLLPNDDFYQMPYDWGYYGADGVAALIRQPTLLVTTQSINYITGTPELSPQFKYLVERIRKRSRAPIEPLLSALGVGWILQRNDIVWSRPYRNILSPEAIRSFLAAQPHIQRVATFGKLDIYRVAIQHGSTSAYSGAAVWPSSTAPDLVDAFQRSGGEIPWLIGGLTPVPDQLIKQAPRSLPTQSARRGSAAFDATLSPGARVLVLHSSYSTGWRVDAGGKELGWRHLPIDGFLNGWIVPEDAAQQVTILYKPARLFAALQGLSLAVLCALTIALALVLLTERRTST
jgi:hypothetical protein